MDISAFGSEKVKTFLCRINFYSSVIYYGKNYTPPSIKNRLEKEKKPHKMVTKINKSHGLLCCLVLSKQTMQLNIPYCCLRLLIITRA